MVKNPQKNRYLRLNFYINLIETELTQIKIRKTSARSKVYGGYGQKIKTTIMHTVTEINVKVKKTMELRPIIQFLC